jgi:hypothetical protein
MKTWRTLEIRKTTRKSLKKNSQNLLKKILEIEEKVNYFYGKFI